MDRRFHMADIDIVAKSYFSNNSFFADAVNYAVYHGEEVVKPESLTELNASAVVVPFEGGMRIPLQRYRDNLKLCEVKAHGNSAYMVLGVEEQTEVDFAMPFRTLLYDAIGYARQVTEINSAYKKNAELNKKAREQRKKSEEEGAGHACRGQGILVWNEARRQAAADHHRGRARWREGMGRPDDRPRDADGRRPEGVAPHPQFRAVRH